MDERDFSHALAAQRSGNLPEAARLCREILVSRPNFFEATYLLGFVLAQSGQAAEAERVIARATELNPRSSDAFYNRACLLQRLNRPEEAIACFNRTLTIRPDYTDARLNRGLALLMIGRHGEALADFDAVLKVHRDLVPALAGRGSALSELGRLPEALRTLDRAVGLERANALALILRAGVLFRLERYAEAVGDLDVVLSQTPDLVDALVNRAAALFELKRPDEAVRDCAKALAVSPDVPYLRGTLVYYRLHACDWIGLTEQADAISARLRHRQQVVPPFVNLCLSTSPVEQLKCGLIWSKKFAATSSLRRNEPWRHDRIRVAYLSADFHAHATAHLMTGVFEHHDHNRFQTYAISYGPDDRSDLRARLNSAFDSFVDVREMSDFEIASTMRRNEIDIAIDLKGPTRDSRGGILAFRPAAVQAHYLGFPGTTGYPWIDYIIADQIVVPAEHRRFYTEAVVWLPGSYQCNADAGAEMPESKSRSDYGLPPNGFVFCCFNNNFKITPVVFDVWMRLLTKVKDSVLWLMGDNPAAIRNLKGSAAAAGIDPERLIFAPRIGLADHLARQRVADIFLDTLPYGAHTTASDALRAGVPIVTCIGPTFSGRVAASLLNALSLPELVSESLESYEAMALRIATDPAVMATIKAKLSSNRNSSSLFDTAHFTRHFETALTVMHERARQGLPPANLTVPES